MDIYILFGQRVCAYPKEFAPEALEVMDGLAWDENADWLRDKLKEYEKTKEFSALRIIEVCTNADIAKILNDVPSVPGGDVKAVD